MHIYYLGRIARRATERLIAELKRGGHAAGSEHNVGLSPTLVIRGSTASVRPRSEEGK